jgi:hypothetical protein
MESKERDKKLDQILVGRGKSVLRDYRYLNIRMPTLLYLFDEKVAFINPALGNAYAAVIESRDVYETLGAMFEALWEIGEVPPVPET